MKKIQVLIADDEEIVREGIGNYIAWDVYNMELAGLAKDGEEALALIDKLEIDLLITDICMPKISGMELVEKIKEKQEQLWVILISGYSDFKYAQEAVSSELIQDYILKPIDFDQMDLVLNKIKNKVIKDEQEVSFPVLTEEEWKCFVFNDKNIILDSQKNILNCLDQGNAVHAAIYIQQTVGKFEQSKRSQQYLSRYCIEIAQEIIEKVTEERGYTNMLSKDPIINIVTCNNSNEMMQYMQTLVEDALTALSANGTTCSAIINAAVQYINQNYSNVNLSLNEVAEHCSISANYLSQRFKEEMNINFIKYLNMLRIKKAKEFLKDISIKVYMVAEMVGYEDVRYFSRIFRKTTGYAPGEYQKKNTQYIIYE